MSGDLILIGPFVAAVAVAIAVLIVDIVAPGRRAPVLVASLGGLVLVAALIVSAGSAVAGGDGTARLTAFGGAYVVDGLTTFLDLLFVGIVAFTIVFAPPRWLWSCWAKMPNSAGRPSVARSSACRGDNWRCSKGWPRPGRHWSWCSWRGDRW
jgi:hypothetical protein